MEIPIWGKSKVNNKEITLAKHIKDVLEVYEHLLPYIKPEYLRELIKIVIEYHDAGKVLPYFQRKTLGNTSYRPFEVYTNIPHSLFSALLVDEKQLKERLNKLFQNNTEKVETYSKYVLSAIAYHHWRESFYDIVEGYTDVFKRLKILVSDENKWNQVEVNLQNVYSEITGNGAIAPSINKHWLSGLNEGIKFSKYVIPPYMLYHLPMRIELETQTDKSTLNDWVLISGFTMISDHFASFIEGNAEDISADKVEIEGPCYSIIKERIAAELKNKLHDKYKESDIWQFQHVDKFKESNTMLLAPTGMGKTEFSYLWTNGKKFFYTLPLRTAVNQIFDRTEKIFGKKKAGILHSDADVYILGEGGESESMRIYDFARQLASPAIVSTGDQFFPYALRPPSYEKIFAKFSYARLIIDEVQAYDPKAAAIIVKFIEHIVQMGGKFLLMTATIPSFIQKEIERRIGTDFKILNLFKEDKKVASFSKHRVQLKVESYREDQLSYSNELIQEIIKKSKENEGNRILVVLNTVKQAQAVFHDLKNGAKGNIDIRLFHSRFIQSHRKKKESQLEKFIGNNDDSRADLRPKILVATQVVEASLDLDADYIYTELAPWDSLIQRMGRVFREYRNTSPNPDKIISKRYFQNNIPINVFVLIYDGKNKKGKNVFESSQGFVYNDDLLRITLKLIDDRNADIGKWLNKPKFDFKKLKKTSLYLTEDDKNTFVRLLFDGVPKDSKYLKNFYGMLQILDAGFMSDRKSDAQKVFREINNVNVISLQLRDEIIQELKKFNYKERYAYTRFKREVLSKYLISVQMSKVKEYIYESNLVVNSIKVSDTITDNKILSKLKNWLFGVYFVDLDYDENGGLIGVKEIPRFEIY